MADTSPHSGALIRGRQVTGVGVASLFSAAVAYVVLVVAARTLPATDNTLFLTYWALLFGTFGVVTGLNPEAGRSSFRGGGDAPAAGSRVVPLAVAFGAATCLVLGLSGLFWASAVLDRGSAWLVVVALVAGTAFSGHLALLGVLASRRRWRAVVLVTGADAAVRLVSVLVAVLLWRSIDGLAVASAVSAGAWLLLLPASADVRSAVTAHGDVPLARQLAHFAQACVASAASAALAVGFPVLIRLTTDRVEYAGAAGLLLAISLTRAPLMVPLTAYQGVALTHFLRHRHAGTRALLPIVGAVLAVTAVGALAAAAVGPFLFGLLLGDRYTTSAWLLAGLTLGAGMLALVTLTGACCLALSGHASYAAGWVVATVVAVLVLMSPLDLGARTVLSLVVAPLCGAGVHTAAIRSRSSHAVRPGR